MNTAATRMVLSTNNSDKERHIRRICQNTRDKVPDKAKALADLIDMLSLCTTYNKNIKNYGPRMSSLEYL